MSNQPVTGIDRLRSIEKPPERPKSKNIRTFSKLTKQKIYLLDGDLLVWGKVNDLGEPCNEVGNSILDSSIRNEEGKPIVSGRKGWPVEPKDHETGAWIEVPVWHPQNYAVVIKPIKHGHSLAYFEAYGETIKQTMFKIMAIEVNRRQAGLGGVELYKTDALGNVDIPTLGQFAGDPELRMVELAAWLMSFHGRVVYCPTDPKGYMLAPITYEDVLDFIDGNFVNQVVEEAVIKDGVIEADAKRVFDELLEISTIWNPELIQQQLTEDGDLTDKEDDDLKNSPQVSEPQESDRKPRKRRGSSVG